MNGLKAWWLGFVLIVAFVFLSEFTVIFREYFYGRLGLNRNLLLTFLWMLPVVASFLAVYFSKQGKIFIGLSYVPLLSLLGPVTHFLFGQFGATIDLGGLAGLRITFQIYLVLSVITIGTGSIAAMVFRKMRNQKYSS